MKRGLIHLAMCAAVVASATAGRADEPSWTKALADPAERGKLHDAALSVRGDTGRWQDEERFVLAPPPPPSSTRLALDDWLDERATSEFAPTADDDNWLLFSTRQLDDNDRSWVERVERRGNRLTVVITLAKWRGKYPKNFTYYQVFGVNLGRLEPGAYEVTCVVQPATFTQFDGTGKSQDGAPKDVRPAESKPTERTLKFTVAAK